MTIFAAGAGPPPSAPGQPQRANGGFQPGGGDLPWSPAGLSDEGRPGPRSYPAGSPPPGVPEGEPAERAGRPGDEGQQALPATPGLLLQIFEEAADQFERQADDVGP